MVYVITVYLFIELKLRLVVPLLCLVYNTINVHLLLSFFHDTSIDFDIEFNEIELVDAASDRKLRVSCKKYIDYVTIQCSLRLHYAGHIDVGMTATTLYKKTVFT